MLEVVKNLDERIVQTHDPCTGTHKDVQANSSHSRVLDAATTSIDHASLRTF